MFENRVVSLRQENEIDDPLTKIPCSGARRLIAQAFEALVASRAAFALPDGRHLTARLIKTVPKA